MINKSLNELTRDNTEKFIGQRLNELLLFALDCTVNLDIDVLELRYRSEGSIQNNHVLQYSARTFQLGFIEEIANSEASNQNESIGIENNNKTNREDIYVPA